MERPWPGMAGLSVMKTKSLYLLGLTLLFVVVIGSLALKHGSAVPVAGEAVPESAVNVGDKERPDVHQDVVLRIRTPPTNAVVQNVPNITTFELLNNGRSPLMCPGTWYLLFDDGRVQQLSLPYSGIMRVRPGGKGTIEITNPVTTGAWRLAANYYFEDVVFHVKVKIDRSALKKLLPRSASSVRGQNVMSDWIK